MLAPFLLWIPRTRLVVTLSLMTMHLGLELGASVGWWQPMMLMMLVVFLPPSWSERVLRVRRSAGAPSGG